MAGFVDEAQVHVKAGDGGAGAVAFRREAHVAKGGPDGGDGGSGGDVSSRPSATAVSLLGFRDHPHRRAENGGHGSGAKRHGRNGEDARRVPVPEGTVVRDLDGAVLADLPIEGDRLVAASGGRGGRGNASFLSNRLRAPAFAEQGELGEERWLDLELKLLADVALVGFPNAGKSTLISPDLRRQAEDRRLPLHHPRAPPRGRSALAATGRRRDRVRRRRHPRPDRGSERGPGPRPPVPPPHRAGPGAGRARRSRAADAERSPPNRSRSCSTSSAATGPSCSSGPGSSSAHAPTLVDRRARPDPPATAATRVLLGDRRGPAPTLTGRLATLVARGPAEAAAGAGRPPVAAPARPRGRSSSTREGRASSSHGRQAARAVAVTRPYEPRRARARPAPAAAPRRGPGPRPGRRPRGRPGAHRQRASSSTPDRVTGSGSLAVIVVVKIGTSSVTDGDGAVDDGAVGKLCGEVGARPRAPATRSSSSPPARSPPASPRSARRAAARATRSPCRRSRRSASTG